jgi:hypothetical protein
MHEVVLGKKKLADDKLHLWNQLCAFARGKEKITRKSGFAKLKFKEWTGDWPPHEYSFDGAPDVEITDAVKSRIKSEDIRRAHRRSA